MLLLQMRIRKRLVDNLSALHCKSGNTAIAKNNKRRRDIALCCAVAVERRLADYYKTATARC